MSGAVVRRADDAHPPSQQMAAMAAMNYAPPTIGRAPNPEPFSNFLQPAWAEALVGGTYPPSPPHVFLPPPPRVFCHGGRSPPPAPAVFRHAPAAPFLVPWAVLSLARALA